MLRILILLAATAAVFGGESAGPVQFRTHVIESNMPGGYSVIVADINHDGRPDVIGMTQRVNELAWYENPNWERHVMVKGMNSMVNLAAADIDGDGIPEVAIQSDRDCQSPGLERVGD